MKTQTDVRLRWMIRRDLPEVMRLEGICFQFPWSKDDLMRALRDRNVIAISAEIDNTVVGYVIYDLCEDYLEVWNIAVTPSHWREGIGTQMLNRLKEKVRESDKRDSIRLSVQESNLSALLFFRSQGFLCTEVKRHVYDEADDDTYVFEYTEGNRERIGNRPRQ